jgi:hypothetical protein
MKKICFETFLPGACDTKRFALVIVTAVKKVCIGRNDTQHNDTQHNDTQHNDTQHTQHNDTQHNDTQHNDTQHKGLIYDNQHK